MRKIGTKGRISFDIPYSRNLQVEQFGVECSHGAWCQCASHWHTVCQCRPAVGPGQWWDLSRRHENLKGSSWSAIDEIRNHESRHDQQGGRDSDAGMPVPGSAARARASRAGVRPARGLAGLLGTTIMMSETAAGIIRQSEKAASTGGT